MRYMELSRAAKGDRDVEQTALTLCSRLIVAYAYKSRLLCGNYATPYYVGEMASSCVWNIIDIRNFWPI